MFVIRLQLLLIILMFFLSFRVFANESKTIAKVKLISTTTTEISGLIPALVELYNSKDSKLHIQNIVLPSGLAIISAKRGLGDVLISHNSLLEDKLLDDKIKATKQNLMFSYFAVVGPAYSKLTNFDSILELFKYFQQQKITFVSRSDNSGTYQMERSFWQLNDMYPDNFEKKWYLKIGATMSQTLNFAYEKDAYTLTDYPSFLAYSEKHQTSKLIYYKSSDLSKNQYRIYLLSPNKQYARDLYDFLLSLESREFILKYKLAGMTPYFIE